MHPEVDQLVRKEFGLGVKEAPARIYHLADLRLPQFAFEWHVGAQKVYRIDIPGTWIDKEFVPAAGGQAKGYCIAEHCLTHGMFHGFVQTFCRGYLVAITHHNQGVMLTYAPDRVVRTDPCPIR
jgi:hypothetical protein